MNEPTISARRVSLPSRSVPVGGSCYAGDVGKGFYENKLKEMEVSAVAGAEPTPQLELCQGGGAGRGGRG